MPLFDFVCKTCKREFEAQVPLSKYDKKPKCPRCNSNKDVNKIIKKSFPKSQSWKV